MSTPTGTGPIAAIGFARSDDRRELAVESVTRDRFGAPRPTTQTNGVDP